MLHTITFTWSDEHGKCYCCGKPAAYTSNDHNTSPENLRCAVCAAYDASHGSAIVYLYDNL